VNFVRLHYVSAVGVEYGLFVYYQVIIQNDQYFLPLWEFVECFLVNCWMFKISLATTHSQFFSLAPKKSCVLSLAPFLTWSHFHFGV